MNWKNSTAQLVTGMSQLFKQMQFFFVNKSKGEVNNISIAKQLTVWPLC